MARLGRAANICRQSDWKTRTNQSVMTSPDAATDFRDTESLQLPIGDSDRNTLNWLSDLHKVGQGMQQTDRTTSGANESRLMQIDIAPGLCGPHQTSQFA
jgi:hypothetical protein